LPLPGQIREELIPVQSLEGLAFTGTNPGRIDSGSTPDSRGGIAFTGTVSQKSKHRLQFDPYLPYFWPRFLK
jgi:hypothetical protein